MRFASNIQTPLQRIVIVGGGLGGLAAARALRRAKAEVILLDKANHHVFQPLLYQVATSILAPENIGSPIRHILRNQTNATVLQATVTGVDATKKLCFVEGLPGPLPYDYLVLATGAEHSYFGQDEFARYAPGLKTLADAVRLRNKILGTLEACERGFRAGRLSRFIDFRDRRRRGDGCGTGRGDRRACSSHPCD